MTGRATPSSELRKGNGMSQRSPRYTRRSILTTLTLVSAGALLTACGGGAATSPAAGPKTDASKPTVAPAAQPAATKPAEAAKPAAAAKAPETGKPSGEGVG